MLNREPRPDYRPDIDGLRALAVLLVVLYHLHAGPFRGGYVGVDVFFVISGFLITRLIVDEVRQGHGFSFSRFYVRRLRRILPALLATCAITSGFAFLLLSPEDFAGFGGSLWTAALSVSNVFFCFSSGYFDAESQTRPLLHLWSLGVEEQFYAVWPLFLVLLLKRSNRTAIWTIVVAGTISLLLAQWSLSGHAGAVIVSAVPRLGPWLDDVNDAAFYLTPFRAFELAIGALMVWGVATRPGRAMVLEPLLLAGLALILVPAVAYGDDTMFQGLPALVPCAGAALVIYAGTARGAGWLLRNPVAVGVGLISYSIYLLHWPLIVLVGQYRYAELTSLGKVAVIGATVGGAAAMYRWVEKPYRHPSRSVRLRAQLAIAVLATLLLAAAGVSAWTQNGWDWRVPPARQGLTARAWLAKERAYCGRPDPAVPRELAPCQNSRAMPRTIMVWGDSHALHLVAGLSEAYPDHNVAVFYRPGCIAASGFLGYEGRLDDRALQAGCVEHNRKTLAFLLRQPPTTVVLTNTKRDTPGVVAPPTAYLAAQLRAVGHRVAILGDFIRPGRSLVACRSVPAWLIADRALLQRCSADGAQVEREWQYSEGLIARLPGVVDVRTVQCPGGTCVFSADDGTPFFRDSNHLTTAGAIRFMMALRERLPIAP